MDIAAITRQYDFNYKYASALVQDIPDNQMTFSPSKGLVNHPAFTIGHLISGSVLVAKKLGEEIEMKENWQALFLRKGPGDPRLPHQNNELYPTKAELMKEYSRLHKKVKELLNELKTEDLEKENNWRFNTHLPTLLDYLFFMCINHEAMHLGQLAAWRREMGMESALAVL